MCCCEAAQHLIDIIPSLKEVDSYGAMSQKTRLARRSWCACLQLRPASKELWRYARRKTTQRHAH